MGVDCKFLISVSQKSERSTRLYNDYHIISYFIVKKTRSEKFCHDLQAGDRSTLLNTNANNGKGDL